MDENRDRWVDERLLKTLLAQQRPRPGGDVLQGGRVRQDWIPKAGRAEEQGGKRARRRPRPAQDRAMRTVDGDRGHRGGRSRSRCSRGTGATRHALVGGGEVRR